MPFLFLVFITIMSMVSVFSEHLGDRTGNLFRFVAESVFMVISPVTSFIGGLVTVGRAYWLVVVGLIIGSVTLHRGHG